MSQTQKATDAQLKLRALRSELGLRQKLIDDIFQNSMLPFTDCSRMGDIQPPLLISFNQL